MVDKQKKVKIIVPTEVCIPTMSWRLSLYVKLMVYLFFSFAQCNHVPLCIKGLCNDLDSQKTNEQKWYRKRKGCGRESVCLYSWLNYTCCPGSKAKCPTLFGIMLTNTSFQLPVHVPLFVCLGDKHLIKMHWYPKIIVTYIEVRIVSKESLVLTEQKTVKKGMPQCICSVTYTVQSIFWEKFILVLKVPVLIMNESFVFKDCFCILLRILKENLFRDNFILPYKEQSRNWRSVLRQLHLRYASLPLLFNQLYN